MEQQQNFGGTLWIVAAIVSMFLFLTGCSLIPEKEIQVVTQTQRVTVPIVARPKPLQLVDTRVYVVNKDNYEQFVKQFTDENGELAYVALAIKDYENLALNIADIKRFIEQQNEIIVYYESAMKKEDEDATKKSQTMD